MAQVLTTPFSNLQLELLKLYAHDISEPDLKNIKHIMGEYFAKQLVHIADDAWQKNNWNNDTMASILNDPNQ
jgi:hypothetical protein